MPLRTLLQGTNSGGDKSDDNTYADVCDELLASGALSPVDDDILLEDPLERGRSRDELAEFIEAEIYNNNQQNNNDDTAGGNANNAHKRSAEARISNDRDSISEGTHPSTSKRSNHSSDNNSSGGEQHHQRRDSNDSQRSNSNRSNAGSTKEENTNTNTSSKIVTDTQQQKKGIHRKTHSFALLEDLSHQQPNYYTLGPILDDSAMRYVEMNPSYSKFDDLEYAPMNPALMVGEFNNMGRNGYNREQQMQQLHQGGAGNTQLDILKQQQQYTQQQRNSVNTNTSPTDNFGGPQQQQQQQQKLPMQSSQGGTLYQQQQQQQQQQRQQQPPPDGVVQQEFTSVHRAGVAGPPPGNISWSHMPPQPGHPNYQHMQPPPPQQQQHQYQMQQGSLQPQQQPGMPPTQAQMTRLDRLKRWKEKRKNRVFTKSIRYMSRKVCADNRPRIKGKFVKVSSLSSLTDIAENNDDEEKMKKKEDEGKDSKPDDGKGEPREKAKSEEANDLIRDLREKAIEAGLGAGKPLSRLRRNNAHSSAPNLASLADMH